MKVGDRRLSEVSVLKIPVVPKIQAAIVGVRLTVEHDPQARIPDWREALS
ncbi:MAG TPA: hypothetical protein VLA12_05005 [Planctomycetaceae bacterium]|nr:hypothetical protein [Planctomycetaceae bacterium]